MYTHYGGIYAKVYNSLHSQIINNIKSHLCFLCELMYFRYHCDARMCSSFFALQLVYMSLASYVLLCGVKHCFVIHILQHFPTSIIICTNAGVMVSKLLGSFH